MTPTETFYGISNRWRQILWKSVYPLSVVAVLAMAEPAQAAVMTHEIDLSLGDGNTQNLDIDNDGHDDFYIGFFDIGVPSIDFMALGGNEVVAPSMVLQLIGLGESVDENRTFGSSGTIDGLASQETFYFGFKLVNGERNNYGWLSFTLPSQEELLLFSVAYESEFDTAIQIVPEPATGVFVSLSAVLMGALALRRRGQKREAANGC